MQVGIFPPKLRVRVIYPCVLNTHEYGTYWGDTHLQQQYCIDLCIVGEYKIAAGYYDLVWMKF